MEELLRVRCRSAIRLSVLAALLLVVPLASAQQGVLSIELRPSSVAFDQGMSSATTVEVTNDGATPITVSLAATNASGAVHVTFSTTQLTILPGQNASASATVWSMTVGEHQVTIQARERTALGEHGPNVANASLSVRVRTPPQNATNESSTAPDPPRPPSPDPSPDPSPGPEPEPSVPTPTPPAANGTQNTTETAPTPAPTPAPANETVPPVRLSTERLDVAARVGERARFELVATNPAKVAQTVDVRLRLPPGWVASLDPGAPEIPAGGTRRISGHFTPTANAQDAEAELEVKASSGSAFAKIGLRVLGRESATAPATDAGEPLTFSADDTTIEESAIDTQPPRPARATPSLRVEPRDVGSRPGTSVVLTLFVHNPGDIDLKGLARASIAPLPVEFLEPVFIAPARDEAILTFTVHIPEEVPFGASYDGVASTNLHETETALFTVRAQGAEGPAPLITQTRTSAPETSWIGALAAGGAIAAAGVLAWRRWPGLGLFILYARLAPRRALEHPRRAKMLDAVREEPGLPLATLARRLALSNGVLRHHVALLEAAGVIRSVQDGPLRRLFPVGIAATPTPPLRERALATLLARGPMRASELATELGVTRQALHYHVKRLADEGRITLERSDAEILLSPSRS